MFLNLLANTAPTSFLDIVWTAVGIIVTALCTWGAGVLISFLNSKIKDQKLRRMATAITEITINAVKTVSQTFVSNIKGTAEWTPEAQKEALAQAVEITKAQLTADVRDFIEENYGDIEEYIRTKIEAYIYDSKK